MGRGSAIHGRFDRNTVSRRDEPPVKKTAEASTSLRSAGFAEGTGTNSAAVHRRAAAPLPMSRDYSGDYDVDVKDFENARWQRGACLSYAEALKACNPSLKYGMHLGPNTDPDYPEAEWEPMHVFVHDGEHAYDSLGRHSLPYDRWDKTEYDVHEDVVESTDFREDGDEEDAWEHIETMHPQYRAQASMLQAGWRFMPQSRRWYLDDEKKYAPQELIDYIGEPEDAPSRPEIKDKYPWAFS